MTQPPSYDQTRAAVEACGVPPGNIRIAYEDLFQSDVVWISDLGHVGDAKLECLSQAVHPDYILLIEDAGQKAALDTFLMRAATPGEGAR